VNVLFLTASYPTPEAPLLAIFVKEHARAAAAFCDVAVLHLDRAPLRRIEVTEARGEELPTWRVRYPMRPAALSYAANAVAAVTGYRRVRRSGFEPDLLHGHFFLAGAPAVALGQMLRKPVVVTEQWSVFLRDDPAQLNGIAQRAAKLTFEQADRVLPVSEALEEGIRALAPRARCVVVPNVANARFTPRDEPRRRNGRVALLAVGAMYEAKGYEFLLDAIARLSRRRRDFHLQIVGEGELRTRFERQSQELGIGDLVTFAGFRDKDEVAGLMRDADLFVITSRYDSNPCAVIEALATGLPVVGTAVGGIPELIGNGSGLLAQPQDAESIADELEAAIDRIDEFDRAAIAARAHDRYSAESVGAAFDRVYREVLAERARESRP
jgi:glycosyltransferase involved in cell wall biosynthesis